MTGRYPESDAQLAVARAVTPMGSQTFSKSFKTLPAGAMPLYAERAEGCRIWDIDGLEYVDLMSALCSVNLGYGVPEVTAAVTAQLAEGVTLSLPTRLEAIVSQQLIDMVPSAEMVHFGKNGSDATTAAIRIARAATGRDHVVTCGYHGWQDWFIGSLPARALGIPESYKELVHPVAFNDLDAMEAAIIAHPTAAVIIEPMSAEWPAEGYLEGVRELTRRHGVVLVFDEMVTGFRFAPGGAQEYFGVTPDLSTLGKGMANGFPLSAIVGRRDLMMVLEDAFISGTFGGELLSLAAARVVLDTLAGTDALARIAETGTELRERAEREVADAGLAGTVSFAGHPAWTFVTWRPGLPQLTELKALFMQEMARNGVLMIATHNISAAHDAPAVDTVADAYRATLPVIAAAIGAGDAAARLETDIAAMASGVR